MECLEFVGIRQSIVFHVFVLSDMRKHILSLGMDAIVYSMLDRNVCCLIKNS